MNIEFIKRQIYNLKDNDDRIQPGDHVSAEAISILKDGRAVDRLACFAPIASGETYTADILCSDCQSVLTQTINKTRLIAYLDGSKPIFCDTCSQQNSKPKWMLVQSDSTDRLEKTQQYIKNYLEPGKYWNNQQPLWERKNEVLYASGVDYNIITQHIQQMPYKEFLQTKFWNAISMYKKEKTGHKCALCGCTENLATHHSSYIRHGLEYQHTVINEDLIVLCKDCHSKFHNKV